MYKSPIFIDLNSEAKAVAMGRLIIMFWLLSVPFLANAQDSIPKGNQVVDSTFTDKTTQKRFEDKSDKLLLTNGFLFKSYNIGIEDVGTGSKINIDPTGPVNIGFGVNYRWLGFAFSFGLPNSSEDKELYGETNKQDFQLNVYSNAFVGQGHLQHYRGFHVSSIEPGDTSQVELDIGEGIVPSLETYSIGLSAWYFLNSKKFSYKAAYVRNAIQTKSAGSPVVGLYYGVDEASVNTNIRESLPDSIMDGFDILGYTSQTFGISMGYSYTVVIKKFFINGTVVPGIGLKNVSLTTSSGTAFVEEGVTGRIVFNMALGFEAEHFLMGLRAFTASRIFEIDGIRINNGTNSLTIFVGKRFNTNFLKKKKK